MFKKSRINKIMSYIPTLYWKYKNLMDLNNKNRDKVVAVFLYLVF